MAFSSMKLKPESGANRINSADDAYSFMVHMQLPIKTSRIGRWPGRPSTMSARQTRVKFRLGEIFGRRPRLKAGL
jgi:hypothetical protein